MALKTIVGIKQLFYAPPLTSIAGSTLTGAEVYALIHGATAKEILNVHADTWAYETSDPSKTDFKNQLTGGTYYIDLVPGDTSITFTIGQYDYETKAELQGGTATATSWERTKSGIIHKTVVAFTQDDTCIILPKAQITAREGMVESKLIGLVFSATPVETGIEGLASEKWFDASEIVAAA
jgi:hypothetical protein